MEAKTKKKTKQEKCCRRLFRINYFRNSSCIIVPLYHFLSFFGSLSSYRRALNIYETINKPSNFWVEISILKLHKNTVSISNQFLWILVHNSWIQYHELCLNFVIFYGHILQGIHMQLNRILETFLLSPLEFYVVLGLRSFWELGPYGSWILQSPKSEACTLKLSRDTIFKHTISC